VGRGDEALREGALRFARDVAENLPIIEPVIEMGARAAPGQESIANLRPIFDVDEYIGCDIQAGPGVDRIDDIHSLSMPDESVGTVVCLETLEHVADPIRAVQEMHRVLKPGGVLAISSLMFFPIHEHPWDFWRFTPEGFERLLEPFDSKLVLSHGYQLLPEGVYGVGVKGPDAQLTPERLPRTKHLGEHWAESAPVDFGPIRLTTRQLWGYAMHYAKLAARRRVARALRRPEPSDPRAMPR
jgi:SAM-dependent methyltransferase